MAQSDNPIFLRHLEMSKQLQQCLLKSDYKMTNNIIPLLWITTLHFKWI